MYACILPHHYFSIDIRLNYFIKHPKRGREEEEWRGCWLLVLSGISRIKSEI